MSFTIYVYGTHEEYTNATACARYQADNKNTVSKLGHILIDNGMFFRIYEGTSEIAAYYKP